MSKKFGALLLGLSVGMVTFAQEAQITISTAEVSSLKDAIVAWSETVLPYVLAIAGVFIGWWLLRFVIGVFKRIGNKAA